MLWHEFSARALAIQGRFGANRGADMPILSAQRVFCAKHTLTWLQERWLSTARQAWDGQGYSSAPTSSSTTASLLRRPLATFESAAPDQSLVCSRTTCLAKLPSCNRLASCSGNSIRCVCKASLQPKLAVLTWPAVMHHRTLTELTVLLLYQETSRNICVPGHRS